MHIHCGRTVATIAVVVAAVAGCSDEEAAPSKPSPSSSRTASVPSLVDPRASNETSGEAPSDDLAATESMAAQDTVTRFAALVGPDPVGSGPAIALRFVRALQGSDDRAAERELGIVGRVYFANHDASVLHRVMADVARQADVRGRVACDRAWDVSAGVAAVQCGSVTVVVHVWAGPPASGVRIGPVHAHRDVFRGPHTHAYTRLPL